MSLLLCLKIAFRFYIVPFILKSFLLGNAGIESHRYGLTVSPQSSQQTYLSQPQNQMETDPKEYILRLLNVSFCDNLGVDQWLFKASVNVKNNNKHSHTDGQR